MLNVRSCGLSQALANGDRGNVAGHMGLAIAVTCAGHCLNVDSCSGEWLTASSRLGSQ
jgi:hypothetical protein